MFIRLNFNFRHINDSVFPVVGRVYHGLVILSGICFFQGSVVSGAGVRVLVCVTGLSLPGFGAGGGGNHCRFQGVCFAVLVVKIKINYLEVLSKGLFISK